ncbi:MAG: hypothetical protein M3Q69_03860 [Acidobacteriota bacterium]|nr:hypothetical protein [Acidobacteriota bacterium]
MNAIGSRILLVLALFLASTAGAAEYSDLYIIPVAGHAQGANGTLWRSDVILHNVQSAPVTIEIALVESGAAASAAPVSLESALVLMPGETRTLPDVAARLGRNVMGALVLGGNMPFAVTSRTWAQRPGGRTLGQSVVPVAITGTRDATTRVAVLPSLTSNAQQRSNVGVFLAASHAPFVAELTFLAPDGAANGSQLIVVNEEGMMHRQIAIPAAAAASTAVVRILQGDGIVVPYASTIDNTSAEALFVSGPVIAAGEGARAMVMQELMARE